LSPPGSPKSNAKGKAKGKAKASPKAKAKAKSKAKSKACAIVGSPKGSPKAKAKAKAAAKGSPNAKGSPKAKGNAKGKAKGSPKAKGKAKGKALAIAVPGASGSSTDLAVLPQPPPPPPQQASSTDLAVPSDLTWERVLCDSCRSWTSVHRCRWISKGKNTWRCVTCGTRQVQRTVSQACNKRLAVSRLHKLTSHSNMHVQSSNVFMQCFRAVARLHSGLTQNCIALMSNACHSCYDAKLLASMQPAGFCVFSKQAPRHKFHNSAR
jgi:hypothetical protein